MYKCYPKYHSSIKIYIESEDTKKEFMSILNDFEEFRKKKYVRSFYHLTLPYSIIIYFKPYSVKKTEIIINIISKKYPIKEIASNNFDKTDTLFLKVQNGAFFEMTDRHLNETGGIVSVIHSENILTCFSQIFITNSQNNINTISQWLPYLYYLYLTLANDFSINDENCAEIFTQFKLDALPKEFEQNFTDEDSIIMFKKNTLKLENKIKEINKFNIERVYPTLNLISKNINSLDLEISWQNVWETCRIKSVIPWRNLISENKISLPNYFSYDNSSTNDKETQISLTFIKYILKAWSNQLLLSKLDELILYDFFITVFKNKTLCL